MNIPTGNVTFLFTDIEGSTRLAQEFPDTLPIALEKHHSIMKKAIESNNGFIFEIIGDAFCCAFANAADAVKAAEMGQKNLATQKWDDAVIKIRIGIHSGAAEWSGSRYMGYITLARTQRVTSAAYGEQIIISNDTHSLIKEEVLEYVSFRDLGERRLKDLKQPLRLYQIVAPGLREDFPPLKTLDSRPNNLPIQLTSFIGREEEMKQIKNSLKQTHLLTLTGLGGTGKTRLALQVAVDIIDELANGVWFVELDSLLEPELLPQAIIQSLGVQEQPQQKIEDTLADYLKDKELLIILDNCEHIIDVCAKLSEKLLQVSPKLKILATSREALRCSGEQTHQTLSLNTPDPKEKISAENLTQYEAVRLFIERALAVNSNFRVTNDNAPALAGICSQLDGIPLAIELAAARINVLTVQKIYERLNDRFKLLTGGKRTSLPRQQTLRALIDWSYELLSENEKILWNRLSVFSGGWTLEASEEICPDEKINKKEVLDLLTNLAEKSIIIFSVENQRYRMLETIKQYGYEKLKEANEYGNISYKHLKFFMELAETADIKFGGPGIVTWLKVLDDESGNMEKGLILSVEGNNKEDGVRLAGALGYFWRIRGNISEGRRWLETVLLNKPETMNSIYCKALDEVGIFARLQGEYGKARKFHEESLGIYREIADKRGVADSLNNLGALAFKQGEYGQAYKLYEESLGIRREIGDKKGIAFSLNNLGAVVFEQGEFEHSAKLLEESLCINREIGGKRGISQSLNNLGNAAFLRGDSELASKLIEESLAIRREIGDKRGIALALNSLGNVALEQVESELASKLYEESIGIFREIGDKRGIALALNGLGYVASNKGEYGQASKLLEESLGISRQIGNKPGISHSLSKLGEVAFLLGEYGQASKLYEENLAISHEIGAKSEIASSLYSLGRIAFRKKDYEQARKYYNESLTLNQESGIKREIVINILGFTELQIIHGFYNQASKLLGFIEKFFESNKAKLSKPEQERFEEIASKLKDKLGEEESLKYYAEGKSLTLEEAIELALSSE